VHAETQSAPSLSKQNFMRATSSSRTDERSRAMTMPFAVVICWSRVYTCTAIYVIRHRPRRMPGDLLPPARLVGTVLCVLECTAGCTEDTAMIDSNSQAD
jgi:hypothetical protein